MVAIMAGEVDTVAGTMAVAGEVHLVVAHSADGVLITAPSAQPVPGLLGHGLHGGMVKDAQIAPGQAGRLAHGQRLLHGQPGLAAQLP